MSPDEDGPREFMVMEFSASHMYARISPRKARYVVDLAVADADVQRPLALDPRERTDIDRRLPVSHYSASRCSTAAAANGSASALMWR